MAPEQPGGKPSLLGEPLAGPKLKVERAKHHIHELHACLSEFVRTDFYHLRVEEDPETGVNSLRLELTKALPPDIPLIIGDAVHNLRASLDLLASELGRNAKLGASDIRFPFFTEREKLVDSIQKGPIKKLGSDVCGLVLDEVKPYKAGNYALWALNKLDIVDKHRLLIPIFAATQLRDIAAEDDNGNYVFIRSIDVIGGWRLDLISSDVKLHVRNYRAAAFDIFFDKGHFFDMQPVIPTLHQLSQLVLGVIQAFEAHCFGKKSP